MRGPKPSEYVSTRIPSRRASTRWPASWAAMSSPRPTMVNTMESTARQCTRCIPTAQELRSAADGKLPEEQGDHARCTVGGPGVRARAGLREQPEAGAEGGRFRAGPARRVADAAGGRRPRRAGTRPGRAGPGPGQRSGCTGASRGGEDGARRRRSAAQARAGGAGPPEEAVRAAGPAGARRRGGAGGAGPDPRGRHEARLPRAHGPDRKSTRLNSSHMSISYAVFCLKKKKKQSIRSRLKKKKKKLQEKTKKI